MSRNDKKKCCDRLNSETGKGKRHPCFPSMTAMALPKTSFPFTSCLEIYYTAFASNGDVLSG